MMDVLIQICSTVRLSPSDHSIQVSEVDTGWTVDYKPNQTLQSLGVSTVKLVNKKSSKTNNRNNSNPRPPQPFQVFALASRKNTIVTASK